jgi:ribose 1,5-bisphosphate isomerase
MGAAGGGTRGTPDWGSIRSDRRHGAYPLATAALRELRRALRSSVSITPARVRGWARGLSESQPAMGPIRSVAAELRELGRGPLPIRSATIERWARRWELRLSAEERQVVRVASRKLRPYARLLLFSHSSVVRRAVVARGRRGPPLEVTVLRSRPGSEAFDLVSRLRSAGIDLALRPDRSIASALRRSDLVVVGADSVYRDGSLLHKVGTRRLAESARRAKVPLVVVAGGSKLVPSAPPRNLKGYLGYDRTPARLVGAYWTDRGAVRPSRRARKIRARPGTR